MKVQEGDQIHIQDEDPEDQDQDGNQSKISTRWKSEGSFIITKLLNKP
jgi:hypothetical protein